MANPPKKKGTGGETELLRMLELDIPGLVRTPAASGVDLAALGNGLQPWQFLATRPDRGQWLITMDLATMLDLWRMAKLPYNRVSPVEIEVKRYRRFALHAIWEKKFGKGKK